jgi:hypothetical protein
MGNVWRRSPFSIAGPGSAAPGAIATLSRHSEHADAYWIAPNGEVRTAFWHTPDGRWSDPFSIAPPGWAAPGAIATLSRNPDHADAYWIAPSGEVRTNVWGPPTDGELPIITSLQRIHVAGEGFHLEATGERFTPNGLVEVTYSRRDLLTGIWAQSPPDTVSAGAGGNVAHRHSIPTQEIDRATVNAIDVATKNSAERDWP